MANKLFNNSLIHGHVYSRQPLASGQKYIDQMNAKAGHHVNQDEIRGQEIPEIISLDIRDKDFLMKVNGKREVGGPRGNSYINIIKFADNLHLSEISNTNGESWRVIDEDGKPVEHFIDPSDKPIKQTNTIPQLSNGYEIRLIAEDGETPIPINIGWSINTLNGIVHFAPDFKPGSPNWQNAGFGVPTLEGFYYVGKSTTENLQDISGRVDKSKQDLDSAISNSIAIQPIKFSTNEMKQVEGGRYTKVPRAVPDQKDEVYQRLSYIVNGYCFEVSSCDQNNKSETIITEMSHRPDGTTEIFMDFLWDETYDQPIVDWVYSEGPAFSKVRTPKVGHFTFVATLFVKENGNRIEVKNLIDMRESVANEYNIDLNSYGSNGYQDWNMCSPDTLIAGGPDNAEADSSINVNINLN